MVLLKAGGQAECEGHRPSLSRWWGWRWGQDYDLISVSLWDFFFFFGDNLYLPRELPILFFWIYCIDDLSKYLILFHISIVNGSNRSKIKRFFKFISSLPQPSILSIGKLLLVYFVSFQRCLICTQTSTICCVIFTQRVTMIVPLSIFLFPLNSTY